MPTFSSALISGASAGIGQAVALALARPGACLHLSGRNAERLDAVAHACRDRGAAVLPRVLDVADRSAMEGWIAAAGRLDLVIANAGIAAGIAGGAAERADQTRAVFATNLDGVLNTVLPAMSAMRAQAPGPDGLRGRIAVIASIAAFLPIPGAPSYCATKAAIDTWMVASAPSARRDGIGLTSVCPGYVRTAMTAGNRRAMPGLMDADRAAALILRGIAAGKVRLTFPWWMGAAARFGGLLPPSLLGTVLRRT
ncbi:MAG: SDR family NAD(P)-dependent oxidoreductase [Acetobacteraceae bacterium]